MLQSIVIPFGSVASTQIRRVLQEKLGALIPTLALIAHRQVEGLEVVSGFNRVVERWGMHADSGDHELDVVRLDEGLAFSRISSSNPNVEAGSLVGELSGNGIAGSRHCSEGSRHCSALTG